MGSHNNISSSGRCELWATRPPNRPSDSSGTREARELCEIRAMKFSRQLLVVLALGCGGSKPAATPPPPPATLSCTETVQKMVAGATDPDPAFAARLVSLCEADQWSEDSKRCIIDAKTPQDGPNCQAMMTEAQSKNIVDAIVKAGEAAAAKSSGEATAPAP